MDRPLTLSSHSIQFRPTAPSYKPHKSPHTHTHIIHASFSKFFKKKSNPSIHSAAVFISNCHCVRLVYHRIQQVDRHTSDTQQRLGDWAFCSSINLWRSVAHTHTQLQRSQTIGRRQSIGRHAHLEREVATNVANRVREHCGAQMCPTSSLMIVVPSIG